MVPVVVCGADTQTSCLVSKAGALAQRPILNPVEDVLYLGDSGLPQFQDVLYLGNSGLPQFHDVSYIRHFSTIYQNVHNVL